MHFSPLPFASFGVSGIELALIVALSGLGSGIIMGVVGMYFQHRRQAMWHETARLALEKGQPVPPAPDARPAEWQAASTEARAVAVEQVRAARVRSLLLGGLINIAIGAGLFIALEQVSPTTAYFAAIPVFTGVALLLVAGFDLVTGRKPGA